MSNTQHAQRSATAGRDHRKTRLVLTLAAVFTIATSAQAQLRVTNGDFRDLTRLIAGKSGWYSGLPNGWSGNHSTYAVNTASGPTPPTCNLSALGFLRQDVGILTQASNVTVSFDVSEPWQAPAAINAAILDGDFLELATGEFFPGTRRTLTAENVPAGTSIIITFQAAKSTPGLDNVSIAVTELDSTEPPATQPPVLPDEPVTVACYYFGNYHPGDPRNEKNKGPGWSEWELVKNARPRFPGHQQPKVPLWGYTDESDPEVMAQKIDAAADHGIHAFIFDWYYYNDGPFLDRPIDQGFLKAKNNSRIKFAFMWANCDWQEIHPYRRGTERKVLYPGTVTPETFERVCDHVIQSYFQHPSYWRIDGRPYFSFYELTKLLDGFGSVEAQPVQPSTSSAPRPSPQVSPACTSTPSSGAGPSSPAKRSRPTPPNSSRTSASTPSPPTSGSTTQACPDQQTDYNEVRDNYLRYWNEARHKFSVPYFPNVTMGWDSSPRACQEDDFGHFGYPFTNTISQQHPRTLPRKPSRSPSAASSPTPTAPASSTSTAGTNGPKAATSNPTRSTA